MNEFSGTISLAIGGFLLSVWLFDGFWPSLIITAIAAVVGFVFDSKRKQSS